MRFVVRPVFFKSLVRDLKG